MIVWKLGSTIAMSKPAKKKPSSVRHTRAVQRDRTKRPPSAPPDEHIVARLTELIHPATLRLVGYYTSRCHNL